MSFLYKALLKNKQQQGQQQHIKTQTFDKANSMPVDESQSINNQPLSFQPQNYSQINYPQFAPTHSKSNSWMWFVIAVLLLIIGLLLGRISVTSWQTSDEKNKEIAITPIEIPTKFVHESSINNTNETLTLSTNDETNKQLVLQSNFTNVEEISSSNKTLLTNENISLEKKIEVSVNGDGELLSRVIDIAADTQSNVSSQQLEVMSDDVKIIDDNNSNIITPNGPNLPKDNNQPQELSLDDVSDELKELFAEAVKATEPITNKEALFHDKSKTGYEQYEFGQGVSIESSLQNIQELSPDDSYFIPSMSYQMHIFVSEKSERWVKINGVSLFEGDELVPGMEVLEIRQNSIIWQGNNRRFFQNSLEDYN